MLGVVQLFLQRLFCIRRLQKRYVAGNAVTSNKIRQGHFLQEGQIFNTFVEISVLKFLPCCKHRYCLIFLSSTAFPATWCFFSFRMPKKHCRKKTTKKTFWGSIKVELHLQALGQNNKPKNSKRMLGVVQLFLQRLFCIRRL